MQLTYVHIKCYITCARTYLLQNKATSQHLITLSYSWSPTGKRCVSPPDSLYSFTKGVPPEMALEGKL